MAKREEYFRKFPLITYNGVPSVNIMKRIDFDQQSKLFLNNFYPYIIQEGETAQSIAHDYYRDVDFDWLIYLSNEIRDPYHDIAFDQYTFNRNIVKKYGSIEQSQKNINCYVSNGEYDSTIISETQYKALNSGQKKYWNPIYTAFSLAGYERNKDRIYVTTNRVISLFFTAEQSSIPFNVGEKISNGENTAIVAACTTSVVTLKHVVGNFNLNSNYNITGDSNTVTINFEKYKLLQQNIPIDEEQYFKQYTDYELEFDINEQQREIVVLDESYASDINDKLTKALE